MSVREVNKKEWTKDGRKWIYEGRAYDCTGKPKYYKSKRYSTKTEAQTAERNYLLEVETNGISNDMTFKELCDDHFNYQKDRVRVTTLKNYKKRYSHLDYFLNTKLKDLNINHFEAWKKIMNNQDLADRTKNDLFKYFKSVLNYGTKRHDFNFNSMYNKMSKFNDPNKMPEEMKFWTHEEFQQFISTEADIKFKSLFEILYYCGCRSGEVRGITWKDIDFVRKELNINKSINDDRKAAGINKDGVGPVKTLSSNRIIPIPDRVMDDLVKLKDIQKNAYGFTEEWYVFGSYEPISKSAMRDRKNANCKISGVKQIRIHDFRHSCASLLINSGANITIVANYLGHTKMDETLKTYTHMFKNKLVEIVDTINNL